MHSEEPEVEPIWDPEEVRKLIEFIEDKLEVPIEKRWGYESGGVWSSEGW